MKKINYERITVRTYEIVKDIDQKLDYLIKRQKGYFDKDYFCEEDEEI